MFTYYHILSMNFTQDSLTNLLAIDSLHWNLFIMVKLAYYSEIDLILCNGLVSVRFLCKIINTMLLNHPSIFLYKLIIPFSKYQINESSIYIILQFPLDLEYFAIYGYLCSTRTDCKNLNVPPKQGLYVSPIWLLIYA